MLQVRLFVVLCALTCWVALALVYWDVESVLATGPILVVLGSITAAIAKREGAYLVLYLGLFHVAVSVLFFGLVVGFGWSPARATEPFLWMGRAYVAGWSIAAVSVWRKPRAAPEWDDALGHVSQRR